MDIITYALGKLFAGVAAAIRALGITSIDNLVFMKGAGPPLGTFYPDQWARLMIWYRIFTAVALMPALVSMATAIHGLRLTLSRGSSKSKADLYQYFGGLAALIIFVAVMPKVVEALLQVNAGIVGVVADHLGPDRLLFSKPSSGMTIDNELVKGLMNLVLVGVELMTNYLYVIRIVVIGASLVLLPLAGWVLVTRHTYTPLMLLLSEIVSNVFMQASHAITIAVLVDLLMRVPSRYPWWVVVMIPTMLPVVSGYLRRLFTGYLNALGVNETKWAGGAAGAIGGIVGVGQALGMMIGSQGARSVAGRMVGTVLGGAAGSTSPIGGPGGGAAAQALGRGVAGALAGGQASGSGVAGRLSGAMAGALSGPGAASGLRSALPGVAGARIGAGSPVSIPRAASTGGAAGAGATGSGDTSFNMDSPSRVMQLGGGAAAELVPDHELRRTASGLYVPSHVPNGGSSSAAADGPKDTSPAESGGEGEPASAQPHAQQPAPPTIVFGHEPQEKSGFGQKAFQAGSTLVAAMIGAGMASDGAHGAAATLTQLSGRASGAAWDVGGKLARNVYGKLRNRAPSRAQRPASVGAPRPAATQAAVGSAPQGLTRPSMATTLDRTADDAGAHSGIGMPAQPIRAPRAPNIGMPVPATRRAQREPGDSA